MTMGIVLVACLAARIADRMRWDDKDIDFELHKFVHEAWDRVPLSVSAAILDHDVFPVNMTEISQPLPQRLDVRPRMAQLPVPDT